MPSPPHRPVILTSPSQMGELLRERRVALGLTVEDVADALWMKPTDLTAAEAALGDQRGGRRWVTQTAIDWAQALGLVAVVMDRPTAELAREASTEPPIVPSEVKAYAGRTMTRTPVRRTTVTLRSTITTPI